MPCIVNKRHLMLVLSLAMPANISFPMHEAVLTAVCWLFQKAMLELMYCFRASSCWQLSQTCLCIACLVQVDHSSLHTASPCKLWRLQMSPFRFTCMMVRWAEQLCEWPSKGELCSPSNVQLHTLSCPCSIWSSESACGVELFLQQIVIPHQQTLSGAFTKFLHLSHLQVPAAQMPHDMLFCQANCKHAYKDVDCESAWKLCTGAY